MRATGDLEYLNRVQEFAELKCRAMSAAEMASVETIEEALKVRATQMTMYVMLRFAKEKQPSSEKANSLFQVQLIQMTRMHMM